MINYARIGTWVKAVSAFFALTVVFSAAAADQNLAGVEFFEKKIRPIFADNCYSCHSTESGKSKGGLKLDTRDNLLAGGENGPAIVPGDPDKSLLIKAVRYQSEDLQMPPKKSQRLSDEQVADLEQWVRMGAPDPRTKAVATVKASSPAAKHWAFQPVHRPNLPAVKNPRWANSPLDTFVLAKLEEHGLTPSPRADRRTLIRRATFDLTGLPPTPEEVEAFVADKSPQAYSNLIDRLLESPHYGERWGRYWLDIARYADSKGYVFEEERRYPYAYTYRDYVIRAFNEDLPYDRFLKEQIAADLLNSGEDKRPLAALGFLTLGRRFLNNPHDIIDDRIDVVTRGTMALTVVCARCHDHKFDPIPTADYYSLYGVFASSHEPAEKPLLGTTPTEYDAYLEEHNRRVKERDDFRANANSTLLNKLRDSVGDYLLAAQDTRDIEDRGKRDSLARERKLDSGVVQRWINSLKNLEKETNSIFGPWFEFAALPEKEFTEKAPEITARLGKPDAADTVNPLVAKALAGESPKSLKEVAERYGKLFAEINDRWQQLSREANGTNVTASKFDNPAEESLRQVLFTENAPPNVPEAELPRMYDVPTAQRSRALQRKVEELDATHPGAPPRAMALLDDDTPSEPHIFKRGNPNNPGAAVPRQFLELIAGPERKPFSKGSGRLELAESIASPENPLTARVMVNRMWLQHFGAALVRTPADFGLRCDPPSHPELLDYLAWQFTSNGWSVKKMHRIIMLSETYQQTSSADSPNERIDPGNQWYWRMNRHRLDFEEMRDSLLLVSGRLDTTIGGRAVDITEQPSPPRRTVYGFVERQNLPGLFRTFDFASPDTTTSQRFTTTVPQQALFLMNSPFLADQARNLMARGDLTSIKQDQQRITELYHLAYQRNPAPEETRLAINYLRGKPADSPEVAEESAWKYGWGEFDEQSARVTGFHSFTTFVNGAWQGGQNLPDEKLGWVMLNATGGHPGDTLKRAAIRRWVAPKDGFVSIRGSIKHESEQGNGVRGRIVSSRSGVLGEWTVHNQKETAKVERLEVKRGDMIDFVVDCLGDVGFDSFLWSPVIQAVAAENKSELLLTGEWNAKSDFSGAADKKEKPLGPWERYGQALLLANEFFFVD